MVTGGNISDVQLENMVNRMLDSFDKTSDTDLQLQELSTLVPVDRLLTLFSLE
jgi:hypothetical protein|tara:strand:- start:328 stop:486 length:159 start_codon:yes stop_codon:yes gene_type:complete